MAFTDKTIPLSLMSTTASVDAFNISESRELNEDDAGAKLVIHYENTNMWGSSRAE
jgi:hypothetical protein